MRILCQGGSQGRARPRNLRTVVLLLWCWAVLPALGQPLALRILPTDVDSVTLARTLRWPPAIYPEESQLREALSAWVSAWHQEAFLEASVDTLLRDSLRFTALFHLGPRYEWATLETGETPSDWLRAAGYRPRLFRERPMHLASWPDWQQRLARVAANRGYPFAKVRLDSLQWPSPGRLRATVVVDRGPLILFEQLEQTGSLRLSEAFLYRYLHLTPGELYHERKLQEVEQRLRELPFASLQQPPRVAIVGDRARLDFALEPRRNNRFDFILGVLPRSDQTGRLLVTAQVNGEWRNALGQGEGLRFKFEQLRPRVQSLEVGIQYPYLLQLPFGLAADLALYRRDTSFINLDWRLAVDYPLPRGQSVEVFWQRQQTNLLGVDSALLANSGRLPDTLDVRRSAFGLAWQAQRLDDRLNPRRGWALRLGAGAGQRSLRRNQQIINLGYEGYYDSLILRTVQYRLELSTATYLPLGGRGVLKTGLEGGGLFGQAEVVANEQYRLGGARLLRGFDEESVFATRFAVLTVEYRFLLGLNTYLYAFADGAWLDQRATGFPAGISAIDWPLGLGAGITFETRAGLFGLSLALGQRRGQRFDPGAPKVHLGYVSQF
ncbi:MAG: BamA/TamA family outer membrane protein [Lewinella sp.]|nr:BamA/TamA family outer membrane protein [Lewinella sp.]